MSRTLTAGFQALPTEKVATAHHIRSDVEEVIAENVQHLYGAGLLPPLIHTLFLSGDGFVECRDVTYETRAEWAFRRDSDLTSLRIQVRASNGSASNGSVRFLVVGEAPTLDLTILPGAEDTYTGTLAAPASGVLRMRLQNSGAGGTVIVYSVSVWHEPLASVPAGVQASGYVPIDTSEYSANAPLAVALRQKEVDNLAVLTARKDTLLGWSDDLDVRPTTGFAFSSDDASGVVVARFALPRYRSDGTMEIAINGYREGASGGWRLYTETMRVKALSYVTGTFEASASWSYPAGALTCSEFGPETVYLEVYGDGVDQSHALGLTLWPGG